MNPALRLLTFAALVWLLSGLVVAIYVEVVNGGSVTTTFSEYVHTEQGARLVGVAMLAVGAGALATAGALHLTGEVLASRLVAVLGVGLGLLAVFPQEPVGEPLTWHGMIHRHVALVIFTALPLAGFALARRAEGRWARRVRWLSGAALGTLALFVVSILADGPSGLIERGFLLLDLALLAVFTLRARASSLSEISS